MARNMIRIYTLGWYLFTKRLRVNERAVHQSLTLGQSAETGFQYFLQDIEAWVQRLDPILLARLACLTKRLLFPSLLVLNESE